jgi:hypothetical protein
MPPRGKLLDLDSPLLNHIPHITYHLTTPPHIHTPLTVLRKTLWSRDRIFDIWHYSVSTHTAQPFHQGGDAFGHSKDMREFYSEHRSRRRAKGLEVRGLVIISYMSER